MWSELAKWFVAQPATTQAAAISATIAVTGAALTAFVALMGIWRTNVGHEKRLKRQLEHDRDKARTDREMDLRKHVYLKLFDAVSTVYERVHSYAHQELDPKKIGGHGDGSAQAFSQANLIGSQELIDALFRFRQAQSEELMRLEVLRVPVSRMDRERSDLQSQIKNYVDTIRARQDRQNEIYFSGDGSYEKVHHRLQGAIDTDNIALSSAIQKRDALTAELVPKLLSLQHECNVSVNRLRQLNIEIVKAAREHLELPFNYEEFRSATERSGGILIEASQARVVARSEEYRKHTT